MPRRPPYNRAVTSQDPEAGLVLQCRTVSRLLTDHRCPRSARQELVSILRDACSLYLAAPNERPLELLQRVNGDFTGMSVTQLRDIERDRSIPRHWRTKARKSLLRHGWTPGVNSERADKSATKDGCSC